MEQKHRLFIYDRKEMGVLILLGLMIALFAFTLGVHLGKRVGSHAQASAPVETTPALTTSDQVPDRQELSEQGKGVPQAADDSINQALHDEVARTGIKLDTPRAVQLPEGTRSANGGATTPTLPQATGATKQSPPRAESQAQLPSHVQTHPEARAQAQPEPEAVSSKFTLQIGSYPSQAEAESKRAELEASGLQPFIRSVDLKSKGKWYRVYVGSFTSREDAELSGTTQKVKKIIDSFIVTHTP